MEGNELKRTVSESDEKNPSLEKLQIPTHFEICKFIREICLKVKAHPKVTATALLVYHRIYDYDQMVSFSNFSTFLIELYTQATFEELDPYLVASSSIWIATKGCEELQLRLRDVVNVVYRALNPDAKPGLSIPLRSYPCDPFATILSLRSYQMEKPDKAPSIG